MRLSKAAKILAIVIIALIGITIWAVLFISIEPDIEKKFPTWIPDKRDIVPGVQNVLKESRRLGGIGGIGVTQIELAEEQFQARYPDYKSKWVTINHYKDPNGLSSWKLISIDYYGKSNLQATHIDHYKQTHKYKEPFYKLQDYVVDSANQQLVVNLKRDWAVFLVLCTLTVVLIGFMACYFFSGDKGGTSIKL